MIRKYSKLVAITTLCISILISPTAYLAPIGDNTESQMQSSIFEPSKGTLMVSTIPKDNVYIPSGTTLDVMLKSQIGSKINKVGDIVDFETAENIIINDVIVIPKGSVGKAVVTEARKAGGLGRKGKFTLEPVSIKTKNGVDVPLTTELKGTGRSDGGAAVVFAAVSIVGGLFMKGTNITYPAGTHFTVAVKNDTDLCVTNENLAKTMEANQPQGKKIVVIR